MRAFAAAEPFLSFPRGELARLVADFRRLVVVALVVVFFRRFLTAVAIVFGAPRSNIETAGVN